MTALICPGFFSNFLNYCLEDAFNLNQLGQCHCPDNLRSPQRWSIEFSSGWATQGLFQSVAKATYLQYALDHFLVEL